MSTIVERYTEKFKTSGQLSDRGYEIIPNGAHLSRPLRPHPVYVEHAQGGRKWDVDGNEIVDFMMGYGALILGHSHPRINEALSQRLTQGTHMGAATPQELQWAELVGGLIPSADKVRFTSSGTESTLLAIRLSRAFTGKNKIVKFREHFHGWHDYVSSDSGINTQAGIPQEALSTVVVVEPDIDALARVLDEDPDIAAVIMEPTGAHWGQFPVNNPSFLENVRELTSSRGVVMIMDEVITAFRLSRGGAQGRYGIMPDLTTMAKIVAGGLPGGAVAGKSEIMDLLAPGNHQAYMSHPGTFIANPLSASAGIACLEMVANEPVNERADAMAERLKAGMRDALGRTEVPGFVHGIASIVHVVLGAESEDQGENCTVPHSVLAERTAAQSGPLKLAMLNEGIDMMGGIGFIVSAAHEEKDIDDTVDGFERALHALRAESVV